MLNPVWLHILRRMEHLDYVCVGVDFSGFLIGTEVQIVEEKLIDSPDSKQKAK